MSVLSAIDRFRLDLTFVGADVSDRVWSTAAGCPEGLELGQSGRSQATD